MKLKMNVVKSLCLRAFKLSSNCHHTSIKEKLKTILRNNQYPALFVNSLLNCTLHQSIKTKDNKENKTNKIFCSIPYAKCMSEELKKIIRSKEYNIAYRYCNKLEKMFTNLKSRILSTLKSKIVYKITCNECPAFYYGQSKRYLGTRINEHRKAIRRYIKSDKQINNKTALTKHSINEGHLFNFEDVRIMNIEPNLNKRMLREMICIVQDKNCIHDRMDIEGLSHIYHYILKYQTK